MCVHTSNWARKTGQGLTARGVRVFCGQCIPYCLDSFRLERPTHARACAPVEILSDGVMVVILLVSDSGLGCVCAGQYLRQIQIRF